jgi:serine protease
MAKFKEDPRVLSVEKNEYFEFTAIPNDEHFGLQPMSPSTTAGQLLNLPGAWDFVKGNAYLGFTEFGIQLDHPDLQANFRPHFSSTHLPDGSLCGATNSLDDDCAFYPNNKGHGTHVAGILSATTNNNTGVAGTCWNCSLMLSKTDTSVASLAYDIDHLARSGAQVINMSLTKERHDDPCSPPDQYHIVCVSIFHAAWEVDILTVASSGNRLNQLIGFPAQLEDVVAVGGVDQSGAPWNDPTIDPFYNDYYSVGSSVGSEQALVAPAKDVLSTVYTNFDWNEHWYCGDNFPDSSLSGYGWCNGTSMAAPHVTGIAGLVRSANPLLNRFDVEDILFSNASLGKLGQHTNEMGYGIPDAGASVKAALGVVDGQQLVNRLTPLFSFYSDQAENYFYTTVPQMAAAALNGTMPPLPPSTVYYGPEGQPTPGYYTFPNQFPPAPTPSASVYIFTTHNNPFEPGVDLVPLYRLSWKCGDYTPYPPVLCNTNPNHVDHTYTADEDGVATYESLGYQLDGIEGYVYPKTLPQPAGTVRLMRRYNPARDDHAIFPETELDAMIAQGYTDWSGSGWLAYVYPNVDTDSDELIDGFETMIGTCVNNWDTDGDGFSDGEEITQHPYTDPGHCTSSATYPWQAHANSNLQMNQNLNYALGYHFTPLVSGVVDQLGGYFNGTKTVKLFNKATGQLLAQATVTAANNWSYTSIPPVNVQAGTTYTVAVYAAGSGASIRYNVTSFPQVYDDVRIDGSTYASTASNPNARPQNTVTGTMYGQADIRFDPN